MVQVCQSNLFWNEKLLKVSAIPFMICIVVEVMTTNSTRHSSLSSLLKCGLCTHDDLLANAILTSFHLSQNQSCDHLLLIKRKRRKTLLLTKNTQNHKIVTGWQIQGQKQLLFLWEDNLGIFVGHVQTLSAIETIPPFFCLFTLPHLLLFGVVMMQLGDLVNVSIILSVLDLFWTLGTLGTQHNRSTTISGRNQFRNSHICRLFFHELKDEDQTNDFYSRCLYPNTFGYDSGFNSHAAFSRNWKTVTEELFNQFELTNYK